MHTSKTQKLRMCPHGNYQRSQGGTIIAWQGLHFSPPEFVFVFGAHFQANNVSDGFSSNLDNIGVFFLQTMCFSLFLWKGGFIWINGAGGWTSYWLINVIVWICKNFFLKKPECLKGPEEKKKTLCKYEIERIMWTVWLSYIKIFYLIWWSA